MIGKSPGQIMFEALCPKGHYSVREGWKKWSDMPGLFRSRWEEDARKTWDALAAAKVMPGPPPETPPSLQLSKEVELRVNGARHEWADSHRVGYGEPHSAVLDTQEIRVSHEDSRRLMTGAATLHFVIRPSVKGIRERLSVLDEERDALLRELSQRVTT